MSRDMLMWIVSVAVSFHSIGRERERMQAVLQVKCKKQVSVACRAEIVSLSPEDFREGSIN